MQEFSEDLMHPLAGRLLEAIAASLGIDKGHTELHLEFEDGGLRRWGTADVKNGRQQLRLYDDNVRHELAALVENLGLTRPEA